MIRVRKDRRNICKTQRHDESSYINLGSNNEDYTISLRENTDR